MSVIFKTKKDIAAWLTTSPEVVECKDSYEEVGDAGTFDEVAKTLVGLIAAGESSPDFGEDWEQWLEDNIEELLQEAVSIVM